MQKIPNKNIFKGFTLVELIIVITILAILGTIAYISFQGYTKDARDGVRISDIKQIYNGLSIHKTQTEKTLLPDNYINIQSGTTTISYQGYAGASVLRSLKISGGKDPGTKDYYIYTTDVNQKKGQLMTYMETADKDIQYLSRIFTNQANALTNSGYYIDKKIYVYGDKIGILTNNKIPLQETTTNTGIDITTLTGNITTYFGGNVYSGGLSTSTGITLVNQINSQITNTTICNPGYSLIGGVCTLTNYFTGSGISSNPYRISGVGLSDTTTIATSCNYYNLNATTTNTGIIRGAGTCGNGSQECLTNGVYLIDPDGNSSTYGAVNVYCDMNTDAGGWSLVMKIDNTPSFTTASKNTGLLVDISEANSKLDDGAIKMITTYRWKVVGINSGVYSYSDNKARYMDASCKWGDGVTCHTSCSNYAMDNDCTTGDYERGRSNLRAYCCSTYYSWARASIDPIANNATIYNGSVYSIIADANVSGQRILMLVK